MAKKEKEKSGYKNPPKEHQFKKGQSGNPKGRPPKDIEEVRYRCELEKAVQNILWTKKPLKINNKMHEINAIEAILMKLQEKASKGDLHSIKFILEISERFSDVEDGPSPSDFFENLMKMYGD